MVPTFITICERFPLTLSGKIDLNALPEPDSSADFGLDRTPPRNALEERITGIWAEVLGLDRVGIHANFFELGGDSIMSIRVVARITEAGYQMSLKQGCSPARLWLNWPRLWETVGRRSRLIKDSSVARFL